ncbi:MAG: hypothetical protein IH589_02325 [Anaerolineales bacterium]|nr:hypothetical protein [Anaerolineales bacterium]
MAKKISGITTRMVIIAMLLMVFPGTALADGGDGGYEATANGYHITLVFSEPVKTGVNEFHVLIADSMGLPVSDAIVEVVAMPVEEQSDHSEEPAEEMHGMEMATETPATEDAHGMSGMDVSEEPETNEHEDAREVAHEEEPVTVTLAGGHEDGEYSGEIHLDASGDWTFNIHFALDDHLTEVEIPVGVPRTISNYGILAGFFGINATVITVAAITKRKSISPKA